MTINRKPTGRAVTIPAGLAWGAGVSMALTLGGAAVSAKLIDREIIGWESMGYAVLLILMASAWTGALITANKVKRQQVIMCLISGAVYYGLLLIMTALFFGGQYSGAGETALVIFCGSMLGVFVEIGRKKKRSFRKRRMHSR